MASSASNANLNNANNNSKDKEQLLVCWLEPQSDAGKVSAIPLNWIVSTISGDGRSPESVVRCRWPRTRRLYRARIVSNAEQQVKTTEDDEDGEEETNDREDEEKQEESKEGNDDQVETVKPTTTKKDDDEEKTSKDESNVANMVKEEIASSKLSTRGHQSTIAPNGGAATSIQAQQPTVVPMATTAPVVQQQHPHQQQQSQQPHAVDPMAIAHALLPTLKKMFNAELSKLSTDIQANFDIIGHKISALDGTVKCIKTRVDRMETLLNTAAQELGDTQPPNTTTIKAPSSYAMPTAAAASRHSSSFNNTDLLSGAARGMVGGTFKPTFNSHQRASAAALGTRALGPPRPLPPRAANGKFMPKDPSQQPRIGQQSTVSRPSMSSFGGAFTNKPYPTSLLSMTANPSLFGAASSSSSNAIASFASSQAKRRRTAPASTTLGLAKPVVITTPNGIDVYLGGDKNYTMPLVTYKDALKNCTRPIATYMVMALIRRYLTPDQMSRTWLTEQQLLGKKDGMLLDQNLLLALKKQSLMQFPGSGIDDRLLVRKLYDVFHGIRRQMRKRHRISGGDGDFDHDGDFGASDDKGDDESGSGIGMDEGMMDDDEEDGNHLGDEDADGFGDEDQGQHEYQGDDDEYGRHNDDEETGGEDMDENGGGEEGGHLDEDGGLIGDLNGIEDLEEMAAKQAAFWAGADDSY